MSGDSSTTETPTPLAVPEAAFTAMMNDADAPMREYVQAIAAPVVAAELRRLQDQLIGEEDPNKLWRAIGRRADQLDGGTA